MYPFIIILIYLSLSYLGLQHTQNLLPKDPSFLPFLLWIWEHEDVELLKVEKRQLLRSAEIHPPPLPELSELPPWRAEGEIKTGCEILNGMKRVRRTNDLFFSAARVCFCETGGSLLGCSYPASSWGRRRLCSGLLMSSFPFWPSRGRCRLAHTSTLTVKGEQLPSGCVFVTPVTAAIKLLLGHFKYSIEPQTKKNNSRTRLSVGHKYTGGVRHTKVWAHSLFRTHKNKRIFKK